MYTEEQKEKIVERITEVLLNYKEEEVLRNKACNAYFSRDKKDFNAVNHYMDELFLKLETAKVEIVKQHLMNISKANTK